MPDAAVGRDVVERAKAIPQVRLERGLGGLCEDHGVIVGAFRVSQQVGGVLAPLGGGEVGEVLDEDTGEVRALLLRGDVVGSGEDPDALVGEVVAVRVCFDELERVGDGGPGDVVGLMCHGM